MGKQKLSDLAFFIMCAGLLMIERCIVIFLTNSRKSDVIDFGGFLICIAMTFYLVDLFVFGFFIPLLEEHGFESIFLLIDADNTELLIRIWILVAITMGENLMRQHMDLSAQTISGLSFSVMGFWMSVSCYEK